MNTVIIYAHPNRDGHCGEFLRQAEEKLSTKHVDYEIIDLYRGEFDPVLPANEHYTSGQSHKPDIVASYQKQIGEAENLLFIFPTWWQSMPAILKGFFDRVFLPGFAFTYKGNMPVGLLQGKRAVVLTPAAGPRIYSILVGDYAVKTITKTILKFCGIKAKSFALGDARELNEQNKAKINSITTRAIAFLK